MANYFGAHNRVRVSDSSGYVVLDWKANLFNGDIGVFLLNEGTGRVLVQRQTGFFGLFVETYALANGERYEAFHDVVWALATFVLRLLFILIPILVVLLVLHGLSVELPFNVPIP